MTADRSDRRGGDDGRGDDVRDGDDRGDDLSGWARRVGCLAAALLAFAACGDPPPARQNSSPNQGAATSSTDGAHPDPIRAASREVLGRIAHAETAVAFHGLRSIVQGPRGASRETRLRVVRSVGGKTLIEWQGAGGSERRRFTAERRFPWLARQDLLLANYAVTLDPAPSPPVAWRETRRVTISARHAARPSMELLVDAETWVVLSEVTRDAAGAECRSARFETFEPGEPSRPSPGDTDADAATLAATADTDVEALATDAAVAAAAPERPPGLLPLAVGDLPAGFERIGSGMSSCGAWRDDFSDGLATVSVLQRVAPADEPQAEPTAEPGTGAEILRRVWLGGAQLATRIGGIDVTVAGSLGPDALLVIVRGLRQPGPDR